MSSIKEGKEILRRLLNSSKFNVDHKENLSDVRTAAHHMRQPFDGVDKCRKHEQPLPESGYQSTNYQSTPYSSTCSSRVISNAASPIKLIPMNIINDEYYEEDSTTVQTEYYAVPRANDVTSPLHDCSVEDISRLMQLLELCQSMKPRSRETQSSSLTMAAKQRDLPNMRSEDSVYNVRYKTQPCIHYQRKRNCPLGDNCHFAHGPNELRHLKTHPKYRTRPCTNFVKTGVCPFGATCSFVHPRPYVPGTNN